MTTEEKVNWLQKDLIDFLSTLDADQKGSWGVMNAQQMVEHLSDSTRQGNGKNPRRLVTPEEHLDKYKMFLMSDKPFRENTRNPEMPDAAIPVQRSDMKEAVDELKMEIDHLKTHFESDASKEVLNPIFGMLNYEQWIQLLHKHAVHHAKQFGWSDGN